MLSLIAISGADRILQDGQTQVTAIAESWQHQWDNVFTSPLYSTLVYYSALFAAGAVMLFVLQFFKRLSQEEELEAALQSMVVAFLVCLLLAGNGVVLSKMTLAIRSVTYTLSNSVLETTLLGVKLADAAQAATLVGPIKTQVAAEISQCQALVGQEQVDCLKTANERVGSLLQQWRGVIRVTNYASFVANSITTSLNDLGNFATGPVLQQGNDQGFLAGVQGYLIQQTIQAFLYWWQWAFANLLEIAMLLTALMGPFAVAGGIAFDGKSFWAWLVGLFSIGFAQVSYNIIVGLAAVVIVDAQATDTNGFLLLIAVFAPALALTMAAGGGIAVFNVISSGIANGIGTIVGALPAAIRLRA